jgi:poly(A) polymerase
VKAIKRVIDLCKKALSKKTKAKKIMTPSNAPIIYPREQHLVSRKLISANAQKVLYRLANAGFDAYLVGGGVRDILLGLAPKDFDIATNATPEQIKGLFRNCRLIGRRFRLAHILFGREIIEVATFRGHHDNIAEDDKDSHKISKQSEHGMLLRDNIYGSIEEDAERRDFTINALYYNIKDFSVYDFAGGVADIAERAIKLIGEPETRYREDPVRMLRAVRFAVKLDMQLAAPTQAPIHKLAPLLSNIPAARMFEEFNKLFLSGHALATYTKLREYDLFKYFFPAANTLLHNTEHGAQHDSFIRLAMANTDVRIKNEQRITPAFLLAAMLWYPLTKMLNQLIQHSQLSAQDRFFEALSAVMSEQQQCIAIPKRFQLVMKDIWMLQDRLTNLEAKRAVKAFEHPKFRAGYDFLLLRAEIEPEQYQSTAQWWTDFQQQNPHIQQQMLKALAKPSTNTRSGKRRKYPRSKKTSE